MFLVPLVILRLPPVILFAFKRIGLILGPKQVPYMRLDFLKVCFQTKKAPQFSCEAFKIQFDRTLLGWLWFKSRGYGTASLLENGHEF
jgi:hypothetical protein